MAKQWNSQPYSSQTISLNAWPSCTSPTLQIQSPFDQRHPKIPCRTLRLFRVALTSGSGMPLIMRSGCCGPCLPWFGATFLEFWLSMLRKVLSERLQPSGSDCWWQSKQLSEDVRDEQLTTFILSVSSTSRGTRRISFLLNFFFLLDFFWLPYEYSTTLRKEKKN